MTLKLPNCYLYGTKNFYLRFLFHFIFLNKKKFYMNQQSSSPTNRQNLGKSLNKTAGGFREMHLNTPERNKTIVVRKIIM